MECPTVRCAYLQIQMYHIVAVQTGHTSQDLSGQPNHILLREGLIVVGNTLVEDLSTGSTVGTAGEGN